MIRRRKGSEATRQPPRGCLVVMGLVFVIFGVQGLLSGHFTWFGKHHNHVELHGVEAIAGACSFLLWAAGCAVMLMPEFPWRKPLAWTAMIGGLLLHYAAPFIG